MTDHLRFTERDADAFAQLLSEESTSLARTAPIRTTAEPRPLPLPLPAQPAPPDGDDDVDDDGDDEPVTVVVTSVFTVSGQHVVASQYLHEPHTDPDIVNAVARTGVGVLAQLGITPAALSD